MLTCGAEAKQSGPKDIHRHSQQVAEPPAVEAEQAGRRRSTLKPKPKKPEDTEAPRPKAPRPKAAQTKTRTSTRASVQVLRALAAAAAAPAPKQQKGAGSSPPPPPTKAQIEELRKPLEDGNRKVITFSNKELRDSMVAEIGTGKSLKQNSDSKYSVGESSLEITVEGGVAKITGRCATALVPNLRSDGTLRAPEHPDARFIDLCDHYYSEGSMRRVTEKGLRNRFEHMPYGLVLWLGALLCNRCRLRLLAYTRRQNEQKK